MSSLLFQILSRGGAISDVVVEPTFPDTAAQRVTSRYLALLGIAGSAALAIRQAVLSLEDAGIYNKLFSYVLPKYRSSGLAINLIAPLSLPGAFGLRTVSGSPAFSAAGVTLGAGAVLGTGWVNDLAINAPYSGAFWNTDIPVNEQIISSGGTPFAVESRNAGKAYVSIWSAASGVPVPATPAGFMAAQRSAVDRVDLFQGATRYSEALPVNTFNPLGGEVTILGNSSPYLLKSFGLSQALTDLEMTALKSIDQTLLTALGI